MNSTTVNFTRHNQPTKRVQITFPPKGRTKQSFKDECDINKILAKYQKTGAIAHVNKHGAEYGFATSLDFTGAMLLIKQAQNMFDGLPSSIRNRFANDPAQFLDFVQDANNEKEMRTLGLLPSEDEKAAQAASDDKNNTNQTPQDKPEQKTEPTPQKE